MSGKSNNPISIKQIEADLFLAQTAITKADGMTSKAGKYYRGQAGYHLQQAAEKLIKIQIYSSGVPVNNYKLYRHSLDDLLTYATSLGVSVILPKWIDQKKYLITSWEAEGRYDLHFVVRMDTLKRCYEEIAKWKNLIKI